LATNRIGDDPYLFCTNQEKRKEQSMLHHVAFEVKNLQEGKAMAGQAGFKVIQSFTRSDGSGFAYLDSDRIGGVLFELIQRPTQKT
jgi:hypothetical protein